METSNAKSPTTTRIAIIEGDGRQAIRRILAAEMVRRLGPQLVVRCVSPADPVVFPVVSIEPKPKQTKAAWRRSMKNV